MKISNKTVFETPWFQLVARSVPDLDADAPFFSIAARDYTCVVAISCADELVLVRQFRPAVDGRTLELPAGHVDPGNTPEEAARKELLEETGYKGGHWEFLTCLRPDTGRLQNRVWCYIATGVALTTAPHLPEPHVAVERISGTEFSKLLDATEFDHAMHLAALQYAYLRQKLPESFRGPL